MDSPRWRGAAAIAAATWMVVFAASAAADPLTPLTPGELQFLDHARQVFAAAHDPVSFRSDGELLELGRFVCAKRADGFLGTEANLVPAVVNQLAVIYLCP